MIGPDEAYFEVRNKVASARERQLAEALALNKQMLAALLHVRKIIVEASETGFNCHSGDWAERLFASQAITFDAVENAQKGAGRNALAGSSLTSGKQAT